jgi:hypothetical protein
MFRSSSPITNKPLAKKFVHPFIEMLERRDSEDLLIKTMGLYMGIDGGTNMQEVYTVDQFEFKAPVLEVFSYACAYGKDKLIRWLMDNFLPLEVSYDNNFCFLEAIKWSKFDTADLIATHDSFIPTTSILSNLFSRRKYNIIKTCVMSPRATGLIRTYRFTFAQYINANMTSSVDTLINRIQQKESNSVFEIVDPVYPNPRTPKIPFNSPAPVQTAPVQPAPVVETHEEPVQSAVPFSRVTQISPSDFDLRWNSPDPRMGETMTSPLDQTIGNAPVGMQLDEGAPTQSTENTPVDMQADESAPTQSAENAPVEMQVEAIVSSPTENPPERELPHEEETINISMQVENVPSDSNFSTTYTT